MQIAESADFVRPKVQFFMNSKGGVGKSLSSCIVAQHRLSLGIETICFDADAMTATLSSFKSLSVRRIEMLDSGKIDARRFDTILEPCLTGHAEIIVDTGASSYAEWANYLIENDVHHALIDAGREVVVHAIVVGGASMIETLKDLDDLATQLPEEVTLIVWLNEHFGKIASGDKRFEDMEVYQRHRARIHALVSLPARTSATFGADIADMMSRHLTFDEAIASPDFPVMAKSRVKRVRDEIFAQLSACL
jgi:hypothetical protein